MKKNLSIIFLLGIILIAASCGEDGNPEPQLLIPTEYLSESYTSNVETESAVISELSALTTATNDAEASAQSSTVEAIEYPSILSGVTQSAYQEKVALWIEELVKAANDDDVFQNPGMGIPLDGEEGGLLGTRLLDENGLELEQMIQKGSFGAALYNHAVNIINGDLSTSTEVDKLVAIHGADPSFNSGSATAAATYSLRRSNQSTREGFFYDIQINLITAKAAIEGGSEFNTIRDEALANYLLAWEKSNFATVIFYCNAAKTALQNASDDESRGDAMHAYAEGVAFARGFRGLSNKLITDAEIDEILSLLLAPADTTAESYKFLNDASLLGNFDEIIEKIKSIYGFTDEEVASFFVNNPT